MKHLIALALVLLAGCASIQKEPEPNTLSRAEKRAGFKLLFDGISTTGWRSIARDTFPQKGWTVENGTLRKVAGERGGDIITQDTYSEFDFRWDWKIQPRGNNGVKYFVTQDRRGVGHEYQMIDGNHKGVHSTASFYEVLAPWPNMADAINAAGEWNSSRIFVRGDKVEHWLNGQKVLEYTLGSPEVKAGIAKSKFRAVPKFGERVKGHILLTDHGDEASFRNVRILDLSKD